MLPTSHAAPINVAPPFDGAADPPLADAFTAFISAAGRLERSYGYLHEEVAQLRTQLEERNRALASSLAENERMRVLHTEILAALPCGVVVIDADRKEIILVNPEAGRLMGILSNENPRWADLPPSIRTMIASGPSQAWRQGDEQQIVVSGSDAERWLRVCCTSIDNRLGRTYGASASPTLILTISDTTSQKQANDQREASRHMVALSEMATLLAHEIRNPLGSLELFASLLAGDAGLSQDSHTWVQHLQAGVRSLAATVNNVLRFHTPGEAPLSALKLRDVLSNGVEFVRPLAQQAGVNVSLEETIGEVEILGDPGALQQLLLNLAHNALRHTPAGGDLFVSAYLQSRADRRFAVVEFSDTGTGISVADLPRIFEAGFSTSHQSTGLGLAVCARIIAQHHGNITATSKLGEGSTFRMELPVL
jgi:signal transduction histidine kinase